MQSASHTPQHTNNIRGKQISFTAAGAASGLILYLFSASNMIDGKDQLVTSRIVFVVAEVCLFSFFLYISSFIILIL